MPNTYGVKRELEKHWELLMADDADTDTSDALIAQELNRSPHFSLLLNTSDYIEMVPKHELVHIASALYNAGYKAGLAAAKRKA